VLQSLSVAGALRSRFPGSEIHWVTRREFLPLLETHPAIQKVWTVDRKEGLPGLLRLAKALQRQGFTRVYDAHNNLRSRLIVFRILGLLHWRRWALGIRFRRRSIYRMRRFFLFNFRLNLFAKPFNGQRDLLRPLKAWGVPELAPRAPQLFIPPLWRQKAEREMGAEFRAGFVALAPSAAFPLKRWPLQYWRELIGQMSEEKFVILGGPEDNFLQELVSVAPNRVRNLAGKLNLEESAAVVEMAKYLISNDTGLLHVAEQLGKPCIALMGPAPFGFPSRPSTVVLERDLYCRPCSKHGQGPCRNKELHKCLVDIKPLEVVQSVKRMRV
jgi:ADP-heptose:LPS heptosyltransferase